MDARLAQFRRDAVSANAPVTTVALRSLPSRAHRSLGLDATECIKLHPFSKFADRSSPPSQGQFQAITHHKSIRWRALSVKTGGPNAGRTKNPCNRIRNFGSLPYFLA